MISNLDIQAAYNYLYECMRNYIWDVDVIEILANIEVTSYDAFVDRDKLAKLLDSLYREIKDCFEDDEDFETAYTEFKDIVDGDDAQYVPLYKVNEVIVKEDVHEDKKDQLRE